MPEPFFVQGAFRIHKTTEQPKIRYQKERNRSKGEQGEEEKSSFQKLMQQDRPRPGAPILTAEKIWERILPKCRRFLIDYEEIVGLRWRNYPIDLFFQSGVKAQDLKKPAYLALEDAAESAPVWQAMLHRCRGSAVLIHPKEWQKMNADLEYAVMLAAETRSILAKQYAENEAYPNHVCISCVIGIDEVGLVVRLFSTGENYKREMMPAEKLRRLRAARAKHTDQELKQAFLEKLRQQKQALEKYRYDTAMVQRLKVTSGLFEKKEVKPMPKAAGQNLDFQENEAAISLMELLTGGL